MASVIWPRGNRWNITQTHKILRGKTSQHDTKVVDQPGDAIIIAKGNTYEGVTAGI
jgi:hypothetical protein